MGNLLCPPERPRSRDRERQRWQHGQYYGPGWDEQASAYAYQQPPPPNPEDKNPKLTAKEVSSLPIEEYETKETLLKWGVGKLKEEVKRARQRSPQDKSMLEGPMPLEKDELVEAVLFARGGETGMTCSICFEDYEPSDGLRVLPCGHRFHIECVDKWLVSKSLKCPLCNHDARSR